MTIYLAQYYDRFGEADYYERHLFRAGDVLQSAELNELQSAAISRLKNIADVLFNDGDVLGGAACSTVIEDDTCTCTCANGAVYLRGAARGIPPRTFEIPLIGLINVGVYLVDTIVTELENPQLRDPAVSMRNYQEPGACRLQITPSWGYEGESGQVGTFYAVYQIENGIVLSKVPPPQVDAMAQYIARYDRQSAGGFYISSGLKVTRLDDLNDNQVFSVADGVARVGGEEIIRAHARRLVYAAAPDAREVLREPHIVAVANGQDQRIELNHSPISTLGVISAQRRVAETLTHGAYSGAMDAMTLGPVVQIVSVIQGATTFDAGVDYKLTADKVDWSLAGAEPSPGSTYVVTYEYIDTTSAPLEQDETGLTVDGTITVTVAGNQSTTAQLLNGSTIQVDYYWAMPRYDLIAMNAMGDLVTVKGVASPVRPRIPATPAHLLRLAVIEQRWGVGTRVVNDGIRMVPMGELNAVNRRIDTLFALVAEERLAFNLTQRDPTAKKGVFTDPLYDDDLRDQGIAQTAAIFRQQLIPGVTATVHSVELDGQQTLDARVIVETEELVGPNELVVAQTQRTGSLRVNPYDSFSPLPGVARLTPAVDYWVDFKTNWLSPVTRQFDEEVWLDPITSNNRAHIDVISEETSVSVEVEKVGTRYVDLQVLRPIEVRFALEGFGPGEVLQTVRFDGDQVAFVEVTP